MEGSKHTLTPPTYFQGVKSPNPSIYAPGVLLKSGNPGVVSSPRGSSPCWFWVDSLALQHGEIVLCEPRLLDAADGHDRTDHDVVVQRRSTRPQLANTSTFVMWSVQDMSNMRRKQSIRQSCPSSVVSKSPKHTEAQPVYSNFIFRV